MHSGIPRAPWGGTILHQEKNVSLVDAVWFSAEEILVANCAKSTGGICLVGVNRSFFLKGSIAG